MKDKILALKAAKNAVILAHYYCRPEVQDVADFVGDSLALSEMAAKTTADVILFAGVHFMGETAKVLSPRKTVLLPDMDAGCSLAASCRAEDLAEFKKKYPDYVVVSYVNTSVGVKALTDVCCTSSNALRVIGSIPAERGIIFAPDRNLGAWLKAQTGRENMVLWDGACHVHEKFDARIIAVLREQNPGAKVVAHPECRADVLAAADFVGSTSAILDYVGSDVAQEFIVVTEPGILHRMTLDNPSKTFIPAHPCNECEYMKLNTLEKIHDCLLRGTGAVEIPEAERLAAAGSIEKMMCVPAQGKY
jgi:quinolinate synthase